MASVTFSDAGRASTGKRRTLATRGTSSFSGRRLQRIPFVLAAIATVLTIAELALRGVEALAHRSFADAATLDALRLSAGTLLDGRPVNAQGYWDDDFRTLDSAATLRVALVGGTSTFGGDAATNVADRLERAHAGVRIDHYGLPNAGPNAFAAQLRREVLERNPQLVLLFLSADDVARDEAGRAWFEPRVWQCAAALMTAEDSARGGAELAPANDYETYLRRRAPFVAACIPAADAGVRRRQADAQRSIAAAVEACRRRNVPVALVLAPAEYQLNVGLAASLCRHTGYDAKQLDLALPQRTLTAYADRLTVPVIDLLPLFREAGAVLFETTSARWNAAGHAVAAEAIARRLPTLLPGAVAAK